jgi:hypothetical protein
MKLPALILFAIALSACSQSQEDQVRTQARQTAEQLKHDSEKALHTTEADARKADAELTRGLDKAREKARRALNQPDDGRTNDKDSR